MPDAMPRRSPSTPPTSTRALPRSRKARTSPGTFCNGRGRCRVPRLRAMNRLLALAALALAACVSNFRMETMDPPASLAAAETAFAAHSLREDHRVAFMANFAGDGVYVRDGWVVANADLAKQAAPAIVLDWRPVYTEV